MHLPLMTERADWSGVRVLVRLDFNVPIEDGKIRDTFRIDAALPTLRFLLERGARVIVISHLGKGKPEDSLLPVADYLGKQIPLSFVHFLRGEEAATVLDLQKDGEAVLLENLRQDPGEEANDPAFADYLASLAEVYVNDAFSVSHRAHASVVAVAERLPSYAGPLLANEIEQLSKAFHPERPFLFILGGAKIDTKMPLLKKFLEKADSVFVGGAIVNNFFKVAGSEIGQSVYDPEELDGVAEMLTNPKLHIPSDVIVEGPSGSRTCKTSEVHVDERIVDAGPEGITLLAPEIVQAKLIIWNGPLGWYEKGYTEATKQLLTLIAESGATSIIGGGDTVTLLDEIHMTDKFSFVSTGGGAMLDFLANETLPGIDILKKM
jgi:3-phosphoglycerate kinase